MTRARRRPHRPAAHRAGVTLGQDAARIQEHHRIGGSDHEHARRRRCELHDPLGDRLGVAPALLEPGDGAERRQRRNDQVNDREGRSEDAPRPAREQATVQDEAEQRREREVRDQQHATGRESGGAQHRAADPTRHEPRDRRV